MHVSELAQDGFVSRQNTPVAVTASTESVRESVAKELKKLRSKLARSQAAFAILVRILFGVSELVSSSVCFS